MTDPRIYGKQTSEIVDTIVRDLEARLGEFGEIADIIGGKLHERILEYERSDLSYQKLCNYADSLFWEHLNEHPEFIEAVEENDACIEHVMESLCSTSKSDNIIERVRQLANDYYAM